MVRAYSALGAAAALLAVTTLPSPEHIVILLGAVCAGVGLGAGTGYAMWLQKTTPARIKAMKEFDEARRETMEAKLLEASEQLGDATNQINQLSNAVDKLEERLEEEQTQNDKLRHDLLEFAMSVLIQKGHLQIPPDEKK